MKSRSSQLHHSCLLQCSRDPATDMEYKDWNIVCIPVSYYNANRCPSYGSRFNFRNVLCIQCAYLYNNQVTILMDIHKRVWLGIVKITSVRTETKMWVRLDVARQLCFHLSLLCLSCQDESGPISIHVINTMRTGAFKLFKCTFPGSKQFKSTFILCFFKYL